MHGICFPKLAQSVAFGMACGSSHDGLDFFLALLGFHSLFKDFLLSSSASDKHLG